MGRKKTKLGKVYFTQETEDAIIKYNQSDDMEERENLYREYIWAPFDKLAENVINRFKFPYMEGSFDDVKSEVVSFLVINLHKYAAGKAGFAAATSPGRFEIVHREPTVILDAAHNPHGAKTLANTMQEEFTFGRVIAVVGVFADKDAAGIFNEIKDVIDGVIVTQSSSPRALPANELAKVARAFIDNDRIFIEPDLRTAIEKAIADANHPMEEESVGVLITGSVITVGEARAILKSLKESK